MPQTPRRPGTVLLAAALGVFAACGQDPGRDKPAALAPRASAVQVWDGSGQLQAAKRTVVDACHRRGVNQDRVALIVAVGMGETADFAASQRDATKDGAGDAANLSAFNLNKSFLKSLGWQDGQGPDLNDQAHLDHAVEWVVRGIDRYGEDGFLNYHRGGSTGFADGCSYGCAEYRQAIRSIQARLLQDPQMLTSAQRVGCDIPHV